MRPDGNPGWTDDRIARLTKLWIDGYSASQIAATLGWISRCAVIGKARRLELPPKTRNPQTRTPPARSNILHLPLRPTRTNYGPRRYKPPRQHVTSAKSTQLDTPEALRVDLLDLRECMCRFPIGDPKDEAFHFCGRDKADGISYCDHHARIAFRPSTPRRPSGFRLEVRYA
jgi:GcrA cell cycle regulator